MDEVVYTQDQVNRILIAALISAKLVGNIRPDAHDWVVGAIDSIDVIRDLFEKVRKERDV